MLFIEAQVILKEIERFFFKDSFNSWRGIMFYSQPTIQLQATCHAKVVKFKKKKFFNDIWMHLRSYSEQGS